MKHIRIGWCTLNYREVFDLFKAWALLSLAFGIALHGFSLSASFALTIAVSAVTVGIGFVLHELAHKYVAQRYGMSAEFFANNMMLVFALLTSFLGLILAAPGAVWIHGSMSAEKHGKIAIAGPLTNIVLALIFMAAMLASASPFWGVVWAYGFQINAFLALFNLLPINGFDGNKVFEWDKRYFALGIIGAAALTFASYLL